MELDAYFAYPIMCRNIVCWRGGFMYLYYRYVLTTCYFRMQTPNEILRCAQDDIPSRGKEREKKAASPPSFPLLDPNL